MKRARQDGFSMGRAQQRELLLLQRSGVFDGTWFLARNPDLAGPEHDPLVHFHLWGWRENRWPNAYFDPAWYLAQNPDVQDSDVDPLYHYAAYGEAEGRPPIAHFDPTWYRDAYAVPADMLCLAHLLLHRHSGRVSPIPEFDAIYYLERYPDVAKAGIDPFEHYLVRGAAEDRMPSATFDPVFYRSRYLTKQPTVVPLLHWRQNRHSRQMFPTRLTDQGDIPHEVRRNTGPGPMFEDAAPPPGGVARLAKLLAFYLPQFHAVPENDRWWGKGFTEWTNVARALPRFVGHYQPRTPRDLGHYDLTNPDVLRRQATMARAAGIHGFVFYFYWFDGHRLLDGPLEMLLADPSIDLPFCLMWANENWTRRWDGSEHEVLMAQTYRREDEAALVTTLVRHFADPRYIRLHGRPVLMIYRAGLIPAGAAARWRRLFAAEGEYPVFIMAQSFEDRDPRDLDMDAAVEFPPHKLTAALEPINPSLQMLDHSATMQVFSYEAFAAATDLSPQPYPLIRTVVPSWDNDARRQGAGMVLHGATPDHYQAWLERVVNAARAQPVFGEALVCINAWNEWGEGAYLEPDVHFGSAFLNATGRAVTGRAVQSGRSRLLLVGHDAFSSGAQLLLLHLGEALRSTQGVDVAFLLLGHGPLLGRYEQVGPTTVVSTFEEMRREVARLSALGFGNAIVNTCAAAWISPHLAAHAIGSILLVHEMPRLLRERNLVEAARDAVALARRVVFAVPIVRDRFSEIVMLGEDKVEIAPQGLYRPICAHDRAVWRARLGVPEGGILVVGLGYADLRKGFDLFLQAWRLAQDRDRSIHMLWVGDIDPTVRAYLGAEMAAAETTGTFHHEPFSSDGGDWLIAADVHVLTSREDPFPTVVMEAMSVGVPTVVFEESGGAPDLLRSCQAGVAVPLGDVSRMVQQIRNLAARFRPTARQRIAAYARETFDFDKYAGRIGRLAFAAMPDVTVVVPNYNYARHLPERLRSIFAQTRRVADVIVLDDASTDDSASVAREVAHEAGRRIRWVGATRNSGSVFQQWRRAAHLARSEWVWIAEADDAAEPGFLAALLDGIAGAPDAVLAFTDSSAIDGDGHDLWPDHKSYYQESGAPHLLRDGVFDAADFIRSSLSARNLILNASAVVWRRSALLAAMERCAADLDNLRLSGDWRLYLEVLGSGGRVVYAATPLNRHRRHGHSVTARIDPDRHLAEIGTLHAHVRAMLGHVPGLRARQQRSLAAARAELGKTSGQEPAGRLQTVV